MMRGNRSNPISVRTSATRSETPKEGKRSVSFQGPARRHRYLAENLVEEDPLMRRLRHVENEHLPEGSISALNHRRELMEVARAARLLQTIEDEELFRRVIEQEQDNEMEEHLEGQLRHNERLRRRIQGDQRAELVGYRGNLLRTMHAAQLEGGGLTPLLARSPSASVRVVSRSRTLSPRSMPDSDLTVDDYEPEARNPSLHSSWGVHSYTQTPLPASRSISAMNRDSDVYNRYL